MIDDYIEFSLFLDWGDFLNKEYKKSFNRKYDIYVKKFEDYEDYYDEYITSLDTHDFTLLCDKVKQVILDMDFLSDQEKAYKIFRTVLNPMFFIYITDNENQSINRVEIKKYFEELWGEVILLSGEARYLQEKKWYFLSELELNENK